MNSMYLYGYLNPLKLNPSFIIPVFKQENNCYIQDVSSNGNISSFVLINENTEINTTDIILRIESLEGIYGLIYNNQIFFETKERLKAKLINLLPLFSGFGHFYLEVLEFIEDHHNLINEIIKMEQLSNSTNMRIWADIELSAIKNKLLKKLSKLEETSNYYNDCLNTIQFSLSIYQKENILMRDTNVLDASSKNLMTNDNERTMYKKPYYLNGTRITVLGGDERELILVSRLVETGATVRVTGFPREKISHGAFWVNSVEEACKDTDVLILPLAGTNEKGVIRAVYAEQELQLTEKAIASVSSNAIIVTGSARRFLKDLAENYDLNLMEIAEMDELAILYSIPTAEGAIQIAMEETDTTIHGSKSCIIGFGRVGVTLARTLKALGSEVTIVAQNPGQLARAYEMGCVRAGYEDLHDIMNHTNIVFNTVPSIVLDNDILKYANPDVLIIDLASQPGGTDFEAANNYGLKAILCPGLPGKVAPVFAGDVLADVITPLIIHKQNEILKKHSERKSLA